MFHLEQETIEPRQGSGEEELLVKPSEEGELVVQKGPLCQLNVNAVRVTENKIRKGSTLASL